MQVLETSTIVVINKYKIFFNYEKMITFFFKNSLTLHLCIGDYFFFILYSNRKVFV